jgi:hypothetical protein
MLVTLALAVMLNAGPVCDALCPDPVCGKVCGPVKSEVDLKACNKSRQELQKDVDFCKASARSRQNRIEDLEKQLGLCTVVLSDCEDRLAKPAPVKKKVVKKPAKPVAPPTPVVVKQEQKQNQQVIVNIVMGEPRLVKAEGKPAKPFPLGIGARGALGLTCNPMFFGVVGVRARLLPAHLGLEVNTQFAYGHSAQLMVYPIQGPIAWHLDAGALLFMRTGPQVNLLVGTGVEVQLVPHLSLTADWRMTIPRPFYLGDSLLKSQLMLGLMLHTW